MTSEITIPLLPCRSIDEVLEFYRALGFEVTYQQSKPNNYAVVQRGGIELHFFSMREYEPATSYSTCYVRTRDVDSLYQAFVAGLRQKHGRLPSAGLPRVIPLKNKTGRREFIVVDPGGNWIRIGQTDNLPAGDDSAPGQAASKLARATYAATLLADSKGDYPAAASMLDSALAQAEAATPIDRLQALVFRAGLAITMGDQPLARRLLTDVRHIPLQEHEQDALQPDLERAKDLEHSLQ
jgi:catechol 2,3-dioxygenase-like lactoylglutathione lyase family enzyme